jgi:hypothetical protein
MLNYGSILSNFWRNSGSFPGKRRRSILRCYCMIEERSFFGLFLALAVTVMFGLISFRVSFDFADP